MSQFWQLCILQSDCIVIHLHAVALKYNIDLKLNYVAFTFAFIPIPFPDLSLPAKAGHASSYCYTSR